MMVKRGEVWRKPSVSYDLRTDNWERIQQWCRHPEQRLYESIRPITLYGVTPAERASETNLPERTRRPAADSFDSSSGGGPVPSDQATTGGSPPFKAGVLKQARQRLASEASGLYYPYRETVTTILSWQCQFVTYSVPLSMHVISAQLQG